MNRGRILLILAMLIPCCLMISVASAYEGDTPPDRVGSKDIVLLKKGLFKQKKREKIMTGATNEIPVVEQVQPTIPEEAITEVGDSRILKEADAITDIESHTEGDILKIILTSNGAITRYKAFSLDDPTRLVIDLFKITKTFPQRLIRINSPYVDHIRIGIHPDKVRLCLDSSREELPPHRIICNDNRLVIIMGEVQKSGERNDIGATEGPYAQDEEMKVTKEKTKPEESSDNVDLLIKGCDKARKWYEKGIDLSDNSESEAACYEKAIELCPEYPEAHNKLGEVYKSWGKLDLAIKEFKAAGRTPFFAEAHNNLGEVYRIQGRYDLAAKEFIEALRINPALLTALNNLEFVNKRLGKYDFPPREPELIPISIFTRIPGMTLPKGKFITDFQFRYFPLDIPAPAAEDISPSTPIRPSEREVRVWLWVLGLRYGLTKDWTVGVMPKFFLRDVRPVWLDFRPSVSGLGDTVVMTKYCLWSRRQTYISALFQLSIPTGDENAETTSGGRKFVIPLGSGSYDYTPGIAFTHMIGESSIHANMRYVITSKRRLGDEFWYNLAINYSIPHHKFESVRKFFSIRQIIPVLELNGRWTGTTTRRRWFEPPPWAAPPPLGPQPGWFYVKEHSGNVIFISPGVQVLFAKGLKVECGVQVPVVRPENEWNWGRWTEDFVVHFGIMKYFF